jgi:hypothetical protein
MMSDGTCAHLSTITTVKHAKRRECSECVKIGARWVICAPVRSAVRRYAATIHLTTREQTRAGERASGDCLRRA